MLGRETKLYKKYKLIQTNTGKIRFINLQNVERIDTKEFQLKISHMEGIPSQSISLNICHQDSCNKSELVINHQTSILTDKIIYYSFLQQKPSTQQEEEVISKDDIESETLYAVSEFFPFARASSESFFHVPNWAKILLFEYFQLKNVKDAIKYLNCGRDREFNEYDLYP